MLHIHISGFPNPNESDFFQVGSSPAILVAHLRKICLGTRVFPEVSVSLGRPRIGFFTTVFTIEVFGLERELQVEDMLHLLRDSFSNAAVQHLAAPESMGRFPWEVVVTFHEEECFDVA
jgi:hypothetical protein